jgi:CRISPR-associated endonuclease/helicase Cas3
MTMDANRLWAKSKRDVDREHPSMFLPGHLSDVYEAALRVLDSTMQDMLNAFDLQPAGYADRLRRIVLLSAAIHDLGKANDHFQGMIRGTRNVQQNPQGLRHEWATILMLPHLRDWLLPAAGSEPADFAIVEWAVAGHHMTPRPQQAPDQGGHGPEIKLFMAHKDYQTCLQWLRSKFALAPIPLTVDQKYDLVGARSVFEFELKRWERESQRLWETLRNGPVARLVAAAKDCLIAADIAGSALPKARPEDSGRWTWITESFLDKPKPGDLQAVVDFRLGGDKPREFQIHVAESTAPVTFVKAGCGTGKTLAAYMWAAKNYPTRRLYFCYPTTGTATEGFRDYLFDEAEKTPRVGADLFHGRSDVDFEIILNTGSDTRFPTEEAARLEALKAWHTPIVACTVDTVLGVVQNNRRGLFAWPALAQSAFVFDEIHAFDDHLFGALLRFLDDLRGLPVLLMTASLPRGREEALHALLTREGRELHTIAGPAALEELPRYHRVDLPNNDALPQVQEAISAGGKVLWVCNTVGRVMEAANRVASFRPLLYHSRFKYVDRVERHKAVIEAFDARQNAGAALAICSQVAEMSLDLSADLLVTDRAPVPAIIQRLGRLNRRAQAGQATKPFIVIEPERDAPYVNHTGSPEPHDWPALSRQWLGRLPQEGISQSDLATAWEQNTFEESKPCESAWLDGGPATTVKELREVSAGIAILMAEDLLKVRARPKDLGRYVLPMPPAPRRLDWRSWSRERGLPVAPNGTVLYSPIRGAEWAK